VFLIVPVLKGRGETYLAPAGGKWVERIPQRDHPFPSHQLLIYQPIDLARILPQPLDLINTPWVLYRVWLDGLRRKSLSIRLSPSRIMYRPPIHWSGKYGALCNYRGLPAFARGSSRLRVCLPASIRYLASEATRCFCPSLLHEDKAQVY